MIGDLQSWGNIPADSANSPPIRRHEPLFALDGASIPSKIISGYRRIVRKAEVLEAAVAQLHQPFIGTLIVFAAAK